MSLSINVRQSDGSTFTVAVESPASTVSALKAAIAASQAIPPEQQRLVFKGRILSKDEEALSSYGESAAAAGRVLALPRGRLSGTCEAAYARAHLAGLRASLCHLRGLFLYIPALYYTNTAVALSAPITAAQSHCFGPGSFF